jgi:hypothetical protein
MEATVTLKATPSEFRLLREAVELAERMEDAKSRDHTLSSPTRAVARSRAVQFKTLTERI